MSASNDSFAGNMGYVKIINTPKFWHYVDFVAVYSGHQQVNISITLTNLGIDKIICIEEKCHDVSIPY